MNPALLLELPGIEKTVSRRQDLERNESRSQNALRACAVRGKQQEKNDASQNHQRHLATESGEILLDDQSVVVRDPLGVKMLKDQGNIK